MAVIVLAVKFKNWGAARAAAGQTGMNVAQALAGKGGNSVNNIMNILKPGGSLIGSPGTSSNIRMMDGGLSAAQNLFSKLTQGGTLIQSSSYSGQLYQLANGGTVGLRTLSTRSGKNIVATIDVNLPGWKGIREIKFK